MPRPWLPLDTDLAWRITAALLRVLPLIPDHCHDTQSFLVCLCKKTVVSKWVWPSINHANEHRPAEITNYPRCISLMKQTNVTASTLLSLYVHTFPPTPYSCLPLTFYLLLPNPQSSLWSFMLLSVFSTSLPALPISPRFSNSSSLFRVLSFLRPWQQL